MELVNDQCAVAALAQVLREHFVHRVFLGHRRSPPTQLLSVGDQILPQRLDVDVAQVEVVRDRSPHQQQCRHTHPKAILRLHVLADVQVHVLSRTSDFLYVGGDVLCVDPPRVAVVVAQRFKQQSDLGRGKGSLGGLDHFDLEHPHHARIAAGGTASHRLEDRLVRRHGEQRLPRHRLPQVGVSAEAGLLPALRQDEREVGEPVHRLASTQLVPIGREVVEEANLLGHGLRRVIHRVHGVDRATPDGLAELQYRRLSHTACS